MSETTFHQSGGGQFIIHDDPNISRDVGLVLPVTGTLVTPQGVPLARNVFTTHPPGTVLGRITASGKYVRLNPTLTDGREVAAALSYGFGDTLPSGDLRCTLIVRHAVVNGLLLSWPDSITPEQKATAIAQLAALGIVVRD